MKRSDNRILTTHAGRLGGSPRLQEATGAIQSGQTADLASVMPLVREEMTDVIRKQVEAGIDIISDGELGKVGFGLAYYGRRLTGLGTRPTREGEAGMMSGRTNERMEFKEFYEDMARGQPVFGRQTQRVVVNGPITYIGQDEVKNDIELFKTSLEKANVRVEETFMCVLAPGWLEHFFYNEYYKNDEEYLFALADAMKYEYKAVVDAGFILQLDDPGLPDTYDMIVPLPSIEEYRKFAELRVEAQNRALEGLPEDRIRYHICWGSWHGPHVNDIELKHVADIMLKVKAQAFSVE